MQETDDLILSCAYNSEVQINRRNVRCIFELILLLGRQGIAYRPDDESDSLLNCGNLLKIFHYKAQECPEFAAHLAGSVHYTSAKIKNDIIETMKILCGQLDVRCTTCRRFD